MIITVVSMREKGNRDFGELKFGHVKSYQNFEKGDIVLDCFGREYNVISSSLMCDDSDEFRFMCETFGDDFKLRQIVGKWSLVNFDV